MDIRKVLHETSIDLENNLYNQQEHFDISDDLKHIRKPIECPDWCSKLQSGNKILPFTKIRIRKKKEISAETITVEAEISLSNERTIVDFVSAIYQCCDLILIYGNPNLDSETSLRGRIDNRAVETYRITFENVSALIVNISGYPALNKARVLFRCLETNVKMKHLE